MITFIMPRGTGKTTQLILESHKTGAIIVAHSSYGVNTIKQKAKELKLNIKNPITFETFISNYGNRSPQETFLIDDLAIFLAAINVVGYSDSSS